MRIGRFARSACVWRVGVAAGVVAGWQVLAWILSSYSMSARVSATSFVVYGQVSREHGSGILVLDWFGWVRNVDQAFTSLKIYSS